MLSFQFPDIDGKEVTVELDEDGTLGCLEDSSGKFYVFIVQFWFVFFFILKFVLVFISKVLLIMLSLFSVITRK